MVEAISDHQAIETLDSDKEANGASKRLREDDEVNGDEVSKKPKVHDESKMEEEKILREKFGPKEFESRETMFNYFFKFLHHWPPNLDINKVAQQLCYIGTSYKYNNEYEHMVLLELLKKGHAEPDKKIGEGIQSFQVRYHPMWKSRCFFLVRVDGSSDDFSFRKCIDQILPLPENLKVRSSSNGNKSRGGHQKQGGGGRAHGRRGRFRK